MAMFGKHCGSRIAETIAFQVVSRDLADRAHALFASIFEIVKAGFQCAAACPFGGFGQSLQGSFREFPHAPVRKSELVTPDIATPERRHAQPPFPRGLSAAYVVHELIYSGIAELREGFAAIALPFEKV